MSNYRIKDFMEDEPQAKTEYTILQGDRSVRARLKGKAFSVPSLVTVAAFFSGFLGIISAIRGDYIYATKCIALSILFDGLDGRVARRLNAATAFGREFDSLSDVVAFGAAPAILVYCWAFQTAAGDFGVLAAFVYTVCAGARLARFNVETGTTPSKSFTGLPSPGAAIAVIALVYWHPEPIVDGLARGMLSFYLILLGGLMVSELPYFSLKNLRFTHDNMRATILAIGFVVALTWYSSQFVVLVGGVLYGLSGAISYLIRTFFPSALKGIPRKERTVLFGG